MIMVVCECAMPWHVCSSCHVHSCALAPKNNVVLSSYQFRHCALCAAYVFAFVWACFGFHGSYCSGERRKASCWDFPYMYVLVPIATKTVMWLFNRNHNSSFNGMRVNPKPHHTLCHATQSLHCVHGLSLSFLSFWSRSHFNALSHAHSNSNVVSLHIHTPPPPIMTIWNTRKTQTIIYYTPIWCAVAALANVFVVVIQCLWFS